MIHYWLLVTRMKVECAQFFGDNFISLSLMGHWRQFSDGSTRRMDHGAILSWENSSCNTLMDHKHLFYLCDQLAKIMQRIQLSNNQQSLVQFATCTQYTKDEKLNHHVIQIITNWKLQSVTITVHIYIT